MARKTSSPFNAFIGWGVSTLLLWLLNRNSNSDGDQEASKYTASNVNQIGSAIPVVLGRAMIKNPLVSYYGDFRADIYTEEYGMHTGINWIGVVPLIVFGILAICSAPDKVEVAVSVPVVGGTGGGSAQGESKGVTIDSGEKRAAILNVIVSVLLWLLTQLFAMHMGKTTIQKGFKYYLGWQHILCWTGDNCGIKKIWMNVYDSNVKDSTETGVWDNSNSIAWKSSNPNGIIAHIDNEDMFGGVDENGGFVGDIRFYFGTDTQPKDSWMVDQMTKSENIPTELKGLTPRYPMYMTCVIPQAYIGKQATIPEMWFEVVNYPNRLGLGKIGDDLNPSEAIYEMYKNENWGLKAPDAGIDADSLIKMGQTLADEKMGVSCLINNTADASSYITSILNHVNGIKYDDPRTGKLTFKLIRPDYDVKDLKVFDTSNCTSMDFTRLDWSETISTVSSTFTDAEDKYNSNTLAITDIANVKITNNKSTKSLEAPYFTTTDNVKSYTKTQLLSSAYPLSTIELVSNRDAYDLTIGEPILVSWEPYGISQQVYRVTDLDLGSLKDGKISITAIEDVYGFSKTDYSTSHGIDWTTPEHLPEDISRYLFMEMPYEITNSFDTYIYSYGMRPTEYTTYWDVWRYMNEKYIQTSKSSQFSMVGRIVYGYPESYIKDQIGFEITILGSDGRSLIEDKINKIEANPELYNSTSKRNLLVVDNEIMSYDTITKLQNGDYTISGVIRGVYDTLPKAHTAESIIYFLDYYQNVNSTFYVCTKGYSISEQLELTSETLDGAQAFDANNLTHMTTKRRSEAPSIMANLKFGADKGSLTTYSYNYPSTEEFSGDLLFTFNPRNKLNNFSILTQIDNIDNLVEESTDIVIRTSCNTVTSEIKKSAIKIVDDVSENKITETLSWSEFCNIMGNRLSVTNNVVMDILTYSINKDIYSYDKYTKNIVYTIPTMTGIFTTLAEVHNYANQLIAQSDTIIILETTVSPQFSMTVNECPLIFVGELDSQGILAQDGNRYNLNSLSAYRLDGKDTNAVIHKVIIEDGYTIKSRFTTHDNNYSVYYKYKSGNWITYTPYQ